MVCGCLPSDCQAHKPGSALEKSEHADMRTDPATQRLGRARFGISVVGCAEHPDKELRRADFVGDPVDDRHHQRE
jgi:hypothetical protein